MKEDKKETIIWEMGRGPLVDFLGVAKGLNYESIIYVTDGDGGIKSVWATRNIDLMDCVKIISSKHLFSRIQGLDEALSNGFFDTHLLS